MRYDLLCSGSKGNCCILRSQDTCLIIDCGMTRRYLEDGFQEAGVRKEEIDALLLTHEHIDHISQLHLFRDIPVYAPFAPKEKGLDLYPVIPREIFRIGSLSVLPLALSHDADITVGYVFDDGKEKLVYITDTGYVRQEYYPDLSNADYYILESNHDVEMLMETDRPYMLKMRILSDEGHLSNQKCANVLRNVIGENTKEITLAHISEEANTEDLALSACRFLTEGNSILLRAARQRERISGGNLCEKSES